MKILSVSHDGAIPIIAYVKQGFFVSEEPVTFEFDNDEKIVVPAGFVFDGASIPPLARSFIESLTNAATVAFIIHDYAYALGAVLSRGGVEVEITREHADWIALALTTWLGLDHNDQLEIYYALRVGGAHAYHRLPVARTIEDILGKR